MAAKRSGQFITSCCLLAGLLAGGNRAEAVLVNIEFGGQFTYVPGALGPPVSVDDTFTGTFQYDSDTAANPGGSASAADFYALTDFSFSSAGLSSTGFSTGGGSNIQMYNDLGVPNYDHFSVVPFFSGLAVPDIGTSKFQFAVLRIDDTTESIFSTALDLPTSLNLNDFNSNRIFSLFYYNFADGHFESIDGSLLYLRTVSTDEPVVPEPATLTLIGLGLASAGVLRRRNVRK